MAAFGTKNVHSALCAMNYVLCVNIETAKRLTFFLPHFAHAIEIPAALLS